MATYRFKRPNKRLLILKEYKKAAARAAAAPRKAIINHPAEPPKAPRAWIVENVCYIDTLLPKHKYDSNLNFNRDYNIFLRHKDGQTYSRIGGRFNLTKQRVWSIVQSFRE